MHLQTSGRLAESLISVPELQLWLTTDDTVNTDSSLRDVVSQRGYDLPFYFRQAAVQICMLRVLVTTGVSSAPAFVPRPLVSPCMGDLLLRLY